LVNTKFTEIPWVTGLYNSHRPTATPGMRVGRGTGLAEQEPVFMQTAKKGMQVNQAKHVSHAKRGVGHLAAGGGQ
jgi:hypothetical protein